ncbi:MAG: GNAT family N-acetyltransferase [Ktedonobacterales bacterium]
MTGEHAVVTYSAATADDIPALARLRWAMEAERHPERRETVSQDEYAAAYAAAVRADLERGTHRAWIAWADGEPVACVTLIWWAMPPTPANLRRKRGFVSSVFTLPAYRRRGISRRLMELLIEGARGEGIDRLVLWASDMGRPLYEGLGFEQCRGLEFNFGR